MLILIFTLVKFFVNTNDSNNYYLGYQLYLHKTSQLLIRIYQKNIFYCII